MSATDLFHVCIHESAHSIVAKHHGYEGWAFVCRDPYRPGSFNGAAHFDPIPRTSRVHRRMVGLAGIVAEQMHADPKFNAYGLAEHLLSGALEISDHDADLAGQFENFHVAECAMLLKRLWPEIEAYAWRLKGEHRW